MKHRLFSSLLFLLQIFILSCPVFAQLQEPPFLNYSLENGLSQNTINSIAQDKQGFLWLATQDGLNRFDGNRFQVFRKELHGSRTLPNNHLRSLLIDQYDRLWIGTFGSGMALLGEWPDSVTRLTIPSDLAQTNENFILDLVQANDSLIFSAGRGSGLVSWHLKSLKGTYHPLWHGGTEIRSITALVRWNDSTLYAASEYAGIRKFNIRRNGWSPEAITLPAASGRLIINCLAILEGNYLAIGTETGLLIINPETGKSEDLPQLDMTPLKTARISTIYTDRHNRIWIGTNGKGIYRISANRVVMKHFAPSLKGGSTINDHHIRTIREDRTGNIWIGTYSGGLNKFNESVLKFRHYKDASEPNNTIVSIFADDKAEKIIAGTFGDGLLVFDVSANSVRRINEPIEDQGAREILAMLKLDEEHLLLGTYNGLYTFNLKTSAIRPFKSMFAPASALTGKRVRSISKGANGDLWIATFGAGLYRLNRVSGDCLRYFTESPELKLPTDDLISTMVTAQGELWVGTYGNGILRIELDDLKLTQVTANETAWSLSSNFILGMHQQPGGIIWVGTRDGLNRFDPQIGRFRQFRSTDGISNNIVYGVLSDTLGRVWISTNNGLSVLSANDTGYTISNYDLSDGLQSREFNTGAFFQVNDWFLFGGINGLNLFFPSSFKIKPEISPLVVTNLMAGRKLVPIARSGQPELILPPGVNDFSLEYTLLEYINSAKTRYRYQLSGYDSQWINSGTRQFLTYTNLPPGAYELTIQASDVYGNWQMPGLTIPVTVDTPFWRSWFAYVFYLFIAGFSIYGFVVLWGKRLERENRILEMKINEKTAELQNRTQELESSYEQLRLSQSYLIQSEKMASLGTLVAGVAHEINNPVNFISSSIEPLRNDIAEIKRLVGTLNELTQIAAEDDQSAEKQERIRILISELESIDRQINTQELFDEIDVLMQGIETGTQRTAEIVKSLRNFSRADSKEKKVYDIHEGLDSTMRILSKEIERSRIKIEKYYGTIEPIICYPGQLNQVFMNLLMNAMQALDGKPDGRIEIITNETPEDVLITIQDNGPGIEKSIQNRIFDPFFTTKDVGKGTGMGLSITYSIIKNHEGTIQVVSEPGMGTGFVITLPKHPEKQG